MSKDNKDSTELAIEEGQDGSAMVELPEGLVEDDHTEEQEAPQEAKQEAKTDADDDADHPDDGEELRAAKRNRRRAKKDLIRKTNEEKDVRLQALQRQNEELMQRLSNVEQRTQQHDVSRIDKAMEDKQVLNYQVY